MITLYGFGGDEKIADFSPFVLKLIAYMKLTGIEFELINDQRMLKKSPKNKLPFIVDKSQKIADSYFILEYLKENYTDLDAHLSDEQKAQAHILARSLDENFYWFIVYLRWQAQTGWNNMKDLIFAEVPKIIRPLIAGIVRKSVVKQLYQQGMGRHTEQEIIHLIKRSLFAISNQLGNQNFYFGEKISSIDVILYAFLVQFIHNNAHPRAHEITHSYENLVAHTSHIQQLLNK